MTHRKRSTRRLALIALCAASLGCAGPRPVLYPNDHYENSGPEIAQATVDECIEMAARAGVDNDPASQVAVSTAGGAAVGGATGAVGGAIAGRPGIAAAAGAAMGGVAGFFRGLFGSREPDPLLRGFVDRCLAERGYEPIGWR